MRVVWTEPALDSIQRAYDYLFEFNPRAAVYVAESLRDAGDSLENFRIEAGPFPAPICASW